jgi:hypothetical protein
MVPDACPLGGLCILTQGGSEARHLIGGDSTAGARPAHDNGFISLPLGHARHRLEGDVGPVSALSSLGPKIGHLVPTLLEFFPHSINQMGSLIGAHCNFHITTCLVHISHASNRWFHYRTENLFDGIADLFVKQMSEKASHLAAFHWKL